MCVLSVFPWGHVPEQIRPVPLFTRDILRLRTRVPTYARTFSHNVLLSGRRIAKGYTVIFCTTKIHHRDNACARARAARNYADTSADS